MSTMLVTRNARKLITVPQGVRGQKGDPGGNVMAIGLFADAGGLTIPAGTDMVRTSGHSVLGLGGAYYVHDAAVDAAYVTANPLTSFIDAGGRGFKLVHMGCIDVTWLGAKLDNATDDSAAIVAAVALSFALKLAGSTTHPGYGVGDGPSVYIPGHAYMSTTTLTLSHSFRLFGDSLGIPVTGASQLRWADGVIGIQNDGRAAIEGLSLVGGFTGTEGEYHAIQASQVFPYRDLSFWNWSGDGMHLTDAGAGNVNGVVGRNVFAQNCRNAYWNTAGSDNSAGRHENWNVTNCREWGIKEQSFLGVAHAGHEVAVCGVTSWNDGVNIGASVVSSGGNRYFAIVGQETGASTNAPSGTTADNTWWAYNGAGGSGTGIPAWFSGILVRASGSYQASGLNLTSEFISCYSEGGQGLAQLIAAQIVLGGRVGVWRGSFAPQLYRSSFGLVCTGSLGSSAYFGTDEAVNVVIGEKDKNLKTILRVNGSVSFPGDARLIIFGNDIAWNYSNGAQTFLISGPNTTSQFGTGTNIPHVFWGNLAIPDFNNLAASNARRIYTAAAAPNAGLRGAGEIAFNRARTTSGAASMAGWICTTTGTPGTWTPFGGIAAHQADSTASDVATLKADFNALLAKLQTAGLMA